MGIVIRRRLRHLPPAFYAWAGVTPLLLIFGGVWRAMPGLLGAAAGALLVAASFAVSSLAVAWAETVALRMVLPVALFTYALKFTALGVAFAAVARTEWAGLAPMGIAVIGAAVAWLTGQVIWTFTAKIPYIELQDGVG